MRLVLLHGLGTGPEDWRPQMEAFGEEREVVAPRLRLDPEFGIEVESERLWEELQQGKVDLCGLSLGALVALRMALDRPDRVRRLVLCAGFASLPWRFRLLQAAVSGILGLLPAGARGELSGIDRLGIRTVFREGRRFRVSPGQLRVPTLVLVGDRDRANLGLSKALAAALPDARLELVPDAGHVANVDAPEAFTALLRSFLDAD